MRLDFLPSVWLAQHIDVELIRNIRHSLEVQNTEFSRFRFRGHLNSYTVRSFAPHSLFRDFFPGDPFSYHFFFRWYQGACQFLISCSKPQGLCRENLSLGTLGLTLPWDRPRAKAFFRKWNTTWRRRDERFPHNKASTSVVCHRVYFERDSHVCWIWPKSWTGRASSVVNPATGVLPLSMRLYRGRTCPTPFRSRSCVSKSLTEKYALSPGSNWYFFQPLS